MLFGGTVVDCAAATPAAVETGSDVDVDVVPRDVGAAAASRSEPLDAACAPRGGHAEYRAGERAQLCRAARQASTRPVEQCR